MRPFSLAMTFVIRGAEYPIHCSGYSCGNRICSPISKSVL